MQAAASNQHSQTPLRVVLLNHVTRPEEVNEPLGIQALSGALSARFGSAVDTRLFLVESPQHQKTVEASIRDFQPHLIGVSSKMGKLDALLELYRFAQGLIDPRPVFVIGDQLATLGSGGLLQRAPDAICVLGEGEECLVGIVERLLEADGCLDDFSLRQRLLADAVPNCAFLIEGRQTWTPRRAVDLNAAVAPDRPFLKQALDQDWIVHAEASRGCPWSKCSFCYINQKYHGVGPWRPAPIEAVVEDLARLSAAGARTIFYTDEDFVGPDWDRAWRLGDAIIAAKKTGRLHPQMAFFISSSAYTLMRHHDVAAGRDTRELLAHWREAGVREIFLGIESGCQKQLRRYVKGVTVEQNLQAMQLVRESGIDLDLGFIPFDPWTSLEELARNLEFLQQAELVLQPVRLLKRILLTPGTPLAQRWTAAHGNAPVDLDNLTLDYEIMDERVARVAELVNYRWQVRASEIYRAQASRRSQLSEGGTEREALTARLSNERADDFAFVVQCVKAIQNNPETWRSALSQLLAEDRVLGPLVATLPENPEYEGGQR